MSPTSIVAEHILFPLLKLMGINLKYTMIKRGFYPFGGGKITVDIDGFTELKPIIMTERGKLKEIKIYSVYTYDDHIAFHKNLVEKVKEKYSDLFAGEESDFVDKTYQKGKRAKYKVTYIVVTSETGSIQKVESFWDIKNHYCPGIEIEKMLKELDEIVANDKVAIDEHHSDQLLVYMALANGESKITVKDLSLHFQSMCHILPIFLHDVKIDIDRKSVV